MRPEFRPANQVQTVTDAPLLVHQDYLLKTSGRIDQSDPDQVHSGLDSSRRRQDREKYESWRVIRARVRRADSCSLTAASIAPQFPGQRPLALPDAIRPTRTDHRDTTTAPPAGQARPRRHSTRFFANRPGILAFRPFSPTAPRTSSPQLNGAARRCIERFARYRLHGTRPNNTSSCPAIGQPRRSFGQDLPGARHRPRFQSPTALHTRPGLCVRACGNCYNARQRVKGAVPESR